MNRQHIHFAIAEFGSSVVISGMRASAEVLIYLNIPAALADGIPLFLSENNVVLSPGVEVKGVLVIQPKYFKHVVSSRNLSPFDPQFPSPLPQKQEREQGIEHPITLQSKVVPPNTLSQEQNEVNLTQNFSAQNKPNQAQGLSSVTDCQVQICKFFRGPTGCRNGDGCRFRHV